MRPLFALLLLPAAALAQTEGETVVTGASDEPEALSAERAVSTTTRRDLDRQLPRSTPDAVRYEPGVFVQQSAHGQGSVYLRGLTGQQTLLLFDGIRLNNSTYRQGPNQYFFTLDSRTLRSIEVQRGGGSTRWGSDALGGVIDAHPIEPPPAPAGGLLAGGRASARFASADTDLGGRLQVEVAAAAFRFVGGFGARDVGRLQGPPVRNPNPSTDAGPLPWVPRYLEYRPTVPYSEQPPLRTQLGTGFRELAGDARLVVALMPQLELTIAGYLYRELDAPRTDQCPPPSAPFDQCTTYEEQFRHLAYAALRGSLGRFADDARLTVSWQEQHERRRLDLTAANLVGRGTDDVETFGVTAHARSVRLRPAPWLSLRAEYGADTYFDWLRSRAGHTYTDTGDTVVESRGQYLDGSTYLYGGAFADLAAAFGERFTARAGARLGWAGAAAPGDSLSGTQPVSRAWAPLVGHAGVEWRPIAGFSAFANWDASYRAPNLDDLTSRQQTGPGFQFENAALEPERAHTFELGGQLRTRWVWADAWLYETLIDGGIIKVSKTSTQCPTGTPQCQGSWSRFQLENAPSLSEVRGVEGGLRVFFPARVALRASIAYAWSEGPRVGSVAQGVYGVVLGERVPLSRTPPINGTAQLDWAHGSGFSFGAALQWAAEQTRLSISDYSDGRIPRYGTPGFAVLHLRASYRVGRDLIVAAVVENLFDSPYRMHGSSVNGAGRGVMLQLEARRF